MRRLFLVTVGKTKLSIPSVSQSFTAEATSPSGRSLKLHSHTMAIRQPRSRNSAIVRASRSAFWLSLFSQNTAFDDGVVFHQQSGCLCQKQP